MYFKMNGFYEYQKCNDLFMFVSVVTKNLQKAEQRIYSIMVIAFGLCV